jgi:hypothetical protein
MPGTANLRGPLSAATPWRESDDPIVARKGIPTLKDRVVQMAVVLILEPIFEADFHDCSHGFRPGRKAHEEDDKGKRQPSQKSDKGTLNVIPSKKSLKKARDAIREKTGPKMCFKPTPAVVQDLNTYLKGWCGYFNYGYPSKGFRSLGHYTRNRMHRHLNRRSQHKYHLPKGMSTYQYLQKLGLLHL